MIFSLTCKKFVNKSFYLQHQLQFLKSRLKAKKKRNDRVDRNYTNKVNIKNRLSQRKPKFRIGRAALQRHSRRMYFSGSCWYQRRIIVKKVDVLPATESLNSFNIPSAPWLFISPRLSLSVEEHTQPHPQSIEREKESHHVCTRTERETQRRRRWTRQNLSV